MKNKKLRIITYALALAGILITALVYRGLPDLIPTNWGYNGNVTYSPKNQVWLCSGMLPLLAILFDFMPGIDPRRENYAKFSIYYDSFCVFMQVFLLLMLGIILSESFYPGNISVGKIITIIISVMFLFLGNIMPKIKSNFYMGLRTPWTLCDEEIWRKAHRLGGKTMFAAGILSLLLGWPLAGNGTGLIIIVLLLSSVVIPALMSFIWWRKKYGKSAAK